LICGKRERVAMPAGEWAWSAWLSGQQRLGGSYKLLLPPAQAHASELKNHQQGGKYDNTG